MGRIRKAKKPKKLITKEPKMIVESGRIRISMRLLDRKRAASMQAINSCKGKESLRKVLKNMVIWRTVIKEARQDEDKITGDGWCGYISMNQILRGADRPTNMIVEGAEEVIESVKEIMA